VRKVDPEKHAAKRQHILAAASRCFARAGFRGASIADICAAAGMSAGHLYHYFASKEAMVQAIVERDLRIAVDAIEQLARADVADFAEAIIEGFERHVRGADAAQEALRVEIRAEARRNPAVAAIVRTADAALYRRIAAMLRPRQRRGLIDPSLNLRAAAALMVALFRGVLALSAEGAGAGTPQLLETTRSLLRRFLHPAMPESLPHRSRRQVASE
jgi:AcrR family transcriptional regulator